MSEPVTNVEIEDVLTSIRRLVSDGDKARTRDTAPIETELDAMIAVPSSDDELPESDSAARPEKLVLTPAFLVAGSAERFDASEDEGDEPHNDATDQVEDPSDQMDESLQDDDDVAPLELTDMVWDAPEQDTGDFKDDGDDGVHAAVATPDRSELVATIAELEAAISTGEDEFEPDGSEIYVSEHMAETIAWPGKVARSAEQIRDAEIAETIAKDETASRNDDQAIEFHHKSADELASKADKSDPDSTADVYEDDDLDGLLEAGGVALDEEALRALVSEVVREELTGPLGERITRNVRKLVRREIYRVLSSQEFD